MHVNDLRIPTWWFQGDASRSPGTACGVHLDFGRRQRGRIGTSGTAITLAPDRLNSEQVGRHGLGERRLRRIEVWPAAGNTCYGTRCAGVSGQVCGLWRIQSQRAEGHPFVYAPGPPGQRPSDTSKVPVTCGPKPLEQLQHTVRATYLSRTLRDVLRTCGSVVGGSGLGNLFEKQGALRAAWRTHSF